MVPPYKANPQFQDHYMEVVQQHSRYQLLPWKLSNCTINFINIFIVKDMSHDNISIIPHFLAIYALSTQSFWFSSSVSFHLVVLTRCIWVTILKHTYIKKKLCDLITITINHLILQNSYINFIYSRLVARIIWLQT